MEELRATSSSRSRTAPLEPVSQRRFDRGQLDKPNHNWFQTQTAAQCAAAGFNTVQFLSLLSDPACETGPSYQETAQQPGRMQTASGRGEEEGCRAWSFYPKK